MLLMFSSLASLFVSSCSCDKVLPKQSEFILSLTLKRNSSAHLGIFFIGRQNISIAVHTLYSHACVA